MAPVKISKISGDELRNGTYVRVRGRYAYAIGNRRDWFNVIDISDPTAPTRVGGYQFSTPDPGDYGPTTFSLRGKYAYVAFSRNKGVAILDISDVANITKCSELLWGTGNNVMGAVVRGRYLYCTTLVDGNWFRVVDVSDPYNPVLVGEATSTYLGYANPPAIKGRYAYINGNDYFTVVDISDPYNPAVVGAVAQPGGAQGWNEVGFVGGRYVAAPMTSGNGINFWDVSDPYNPSLASSLVTEDYFDDNAAVNVVGRYVYCTLHADFGARTNNTGVTVVDASDIENPQAVGALLDDPDLQWAMGHDVRGRYVYGVTDSSDGSTGGFFVVDISDPVF